MTRSSVPFALTLAMTLRGRIRNRFTSVTRPTIENVLLFVLIASIYLYRLGTLVPELNAFESWVDVRMPLLDLSWAEKKRAFLRFDSNDAMAATNAPQWLLAVRASILVFGDNVVARRLPSVLVSSFSPVLLASLVRRFYRPDIAFFVGLLFGCTTYQIGFARNGGYVAATTTLFLLLIYVTLIITIENKRRPWILLALAFVLLPFMYAPIRYMWVLAAVMVGTAFVMRRNFRSNHSWCLVSFLVFVVLAYLPLASGGLREASLQFFAARGEQFLYTRRAFDRLSARGEGERTGVLEALEPLLFESFPLRLRELSDYFGGGVRDRFFANQCGYGAERRVWVALFWIGFASAIVSSYRRKRYLLLPAWSCWTWLPLLVTTGLTPVRLLIGLPADTALAALGAVAAVDAVPSRWKAGFVGRLFYLPFAAVMLWGCFLGVRCYFAHPLP